MSGGVGHAFFAPAPRAVAPLLVEELRALGAGGVERTGAGVAFAGPLETAYRACLWSRLASRVLLEVAQVEAPTADALYEAVRALPWDEHLEATGSLAVSFNGTSPQIRNSHFGALRVKDAIVDGFRQRCGVRPSVDLERPDLRVNVRLHEGRAVVSVDLSGAGLHRRGYRVVPVTAPLKESLAAAVLVRSGWPAVAAAGGMLLDPMCGSGTFLIEGAWMAADRAPALDRDDLGLCTWAGHDEGLWRRLVAEARSRAEAGLPQLPPILGYDADPKAVQAARANLRRAGLEGRVEVAQRALQAGAGPGEGAATGLVVANPPYGHRLSEATGVRALYLELVAQRPSRFAGWRMAVLSANPEWADALGLRCLHETFENGPLACRLLLGAVPSGGGAVPPPAVGTRAGSRPGARNGGAQGAGEGVGGPAPAAGPSGDALPAAAGGEPRAAPAAAGVAAARVTTAVSAGAQMLANRLRRNLRTLGKWARKAGVTCYRLYDADLPEYAVAVDLYAGERLWAHVQEYRAPAHIDPGRAAARLQEALTTIAAVLQVPRSQLFFKLREKKKGASQYQRLGDGRGEVHEVREGPCTFLVNFTDYLDTGLFLDHRLTRERIRQLAPGRRFLNLFAYTGTATVHAAAGRAVATTTVDLSRTYLDWAQRNLALNSFSGPGHDLVQADCCAWLDAARRQRYGLIFLDPPTFSNSKRMESAFDIQRDHPTLIRQAARLLTADGVLLFATNCRQFRLDEAALQGLHCADITRQTLPRDFERNPRIHQCFEIRPAAE